VTERFFASPVPSKGAWRFILMLATCAVSCAIFGLAIAESTHGATTPASSDNLDGCREVSGSPAAAPDCGAFRNTCAGYTMESGDRAYEEYQAGLSRSVIDGISFPRTARTQFRGVRGSVDQFTVPKVLRAIGGDPTPTIGSRLFWLAQSALVRPQTLTAGSSVLIRHERLGLPTPFAPSEKVLSNHGILSDV
jgi:hypothetical protein